MFEGYGMSNSTEVNCPVCDGVGEIPDNDPKDPADQTFRECPCCQGAGAATFFQIREYREWQESFYQ